MAERIIIKQDFIEVSHRHDINPRGWNSTPDYDIPEEVNSEKSPFKPVIFLMPPEKLGTHEATKDEELSKIKFSNGWNGPAVAVAVMEPLPYFRYLIRFSNSIGVINNVSLGLFLVLDGHHRVAAAIQEGLSHIPVQLFPYPYDKRVVLDTWLSDGKVLSHNEVLSMSLNKNKVAEAKRTKFGIWCLDNTIRRVASTQPNVKIPLKVLQYS